MAAPFESAGVCAQDLCPIYGLCQPSQRPQLVEACEAVDGAANLKIDEYVAWMSVAASMHDFSLLTALCGGARSGAGAIEGEK